MFAANGKLAIGSEQRLAGLPAVRSELLLKLRYDFSRQTQKIPLVKVKVILLSKEQWQPDKII